MTDERTIEARIYERLSKVIDPELGRSVTDLGMIAAIDAIPVEGKANTYEVRVEVELTVEGCPLSQTITNQINGAVASYPDATPSPRILPPLSRRSVMIRPPLMPTSMDSRCRDCSACTRNPPI